MELQQNQVSKNIFIGDSSMARDKEWLKEKKITHIVNATEEIPNFYQGEFHYLKMNLFDSLHDDLLLKLEPSYRYINGVLNRNPNNVILIHCHMGISRSASTVIYYLMRSKGWSYEKSLNYLRGVRPIVAPNPWYEKQLMDADLTKK